MHYSVLIIGKNPEDLLEPYSEHIDVPPYFDKQYGSNIKVTYEGFLHRLEALLQAGVADDIKEYLDAKDFVFNIQKSGDDDDEIKRIGKVIEIWTDISLEDFARKHYGKGVIWDEHWNELFTQNPNSHWDWFELGGRWSKCLWTKEGKGVDESINGLIDWELSAKKLGEFQALKETVKFSTFAVITENGVWHEPKKSVKHDSGYMSSSEADDERWNNEYFKRFIEGLNENVLVSMYDIHS